MFDGGLGQRHPSGCDTQIVPFVHAQNPSLRKQTGSQVPETGFHPQVFSQTLYAHPNQTTSTAPPFPDTIDPRRDLLKSSNSDGTQQRSPPSLPSHCSDISNNSLTLPTSQNMDMALVPAFTSMYTSIMERLDRVEGDNKLLFEQQAAHFDDRLINLESELESSRTEVYRVFQDSQERAEAHAFKSHCLFDIGMRKLTTLSEGTSAMQAGGIDVLLNRMERMENSVSDLCGWVLPAKSEDIQGESLKTLKTRMDNLEILFAGFMENQARPGIFNHPIRVATHEVGTSPCVTPTTEATTTRIDPLVLGQQRCYRDAGVDVYSNPEDTGVGATSSTLNVTQIRIPSTSRPIPRFADASIGSSCTDQGVGPSSHADVSTSRISFMMSPPSSPVCRFQSDSGLQNAPELRPAEWLDDESFLLASPRSTDQDDDVEMDSEMLARDFSHASNATLGPRESVESSAEESIFDVQASIGAGCPDVEAVASIGVGVNCEAEPEELSADFIRSPSLGSDVQVDTVLISSGAQSIGDSSDENDGEASGTLSAPGSAEKITIYSEIKCPDRNANAMDDVEREPISEPHEELDDEPLRATFRLTSPGRTSQTDDTEMVLKDAFRFRGLLEESDSEGTLTPCGSVEPVMKEDAFDIRASLAPEYPIDNIEIKPILKSELARLAQELDGILTAQETADEVSGAEGPSIVPNVTLNTGVLGSSSLIGELPGSFDNATSGVAKRQRSLSFSSLSSLSSLSSDDESESDIATPELGGQSDDAGSGRPTGSVQLTKPRPSRGNGKTGKRPAGRPRKRRLTEPAQASASRGLKRRRRRKTETRPGPVGGDPDRFYLARLIARCPLDSSVDPPGYMYLFKWTGYCIGESTWGTTDSIEEGASGFVARFEKAARLEGLPVDDPRAEIRLKEALTWS